MAKALNLNTVKNFFKGTMQVPFTNQRMPKTVVYGALGVAVIGGLYFANANGWIQLPKELVDLFGGGSKGGPVAVGAIIETPTMIKPGVPYPIKGTFVNESQEPRKIKQGFWYVIDEKGETKLNGTLGNDISEFATDIDLSSLPPEKDYELVISDGPANSAKASFAVVA